MKDVEIVAVFLIVVGIPVILAVAYIRHKARTATF